MAGDTPSPEESKQALLDCMAQAEQVVDAAVGPVDDKQLTSGQWLVLGLWLGCRDLHEAIGTLLSGGFYTEARILARPMVEDFLRLVFLYQNRDKLEEWTIRFYLASYEQEGRLVRSARRLWLDIADELADQVDRGNAVWKQRAKAAGLKERGFPDYPELVQAAGRDEVAHLILFLHHAVHSNRSAVELWVRTNARDADPRDALGEVAFTSYDVTLALLWATRVAGCLLNWPNACVQELGDDVRHAMEASLEAARLPLVQVLDESGAEARPTSAGGRLSRGPQ